MKSLNQIFSNKHKQVAIKKSKITSFSTTVILYTLLALASLSMASCSSDDPIDPIQEDVEEVVVLPTLELTNGTENITQGVLGAPGFGSLQHTVKATATEGFSKLIIYKVVDGIQSEYITFDTTNPNYVEGSNTFTHNLSYIFTDIDVNKELYFVAEVRDVLNNSITLDFAEAQVKRPMLFSYLAMRTDNPVSATANIPYYAYADNSELKKVNLNGIMNSPLDQNVFAILSLNDGSGLYFSAPNTTLETQLTDQLSHKSTTKFKEQDFGSDQFYGYTIYDSHKMKSLFDDASFNSHEEKAEGVAIGKTYSFLTENGEAGLMYVKDLEVAGNIFYVDVDVLFAR